jgi:aromatic ring-opening dioxygenase catalytic subunit (LigB family)
MASLPKLPTYFLSHGGGPWPWLTREMPGVYDLLDASLRAIPAELAIKPRAILMVSGHWESPGFAVQAGAQPGMLYDYGGFPDHTYRVRYAAPGAPALATRVKALLDGAGLGTRLDAERGYDHGAFVPLAVMYPAADVPVVQLSLREDYDPAAHFAAGRALAPLREEGVLIVGSGLSYHNLRRFGPAAHADSGAFDAWLNAALAQSPAERERHLRDWAAAPSARVAHPREDHLVPLFVALGAALGEGAERIYHEDAFFGGIVVSSFRFGNSH